MINSGRSLLLPLFALLALFSAIALAAPHGGPHAHDRVVHNMTLGALSKRYDNARFTFYDAGENACGGEDSNTDYVMALSSALYGNGEHCYKSVTIQYNGKQVQARVTDQCPGCNNAQADLSRPLFAHLAPLDEGVIYGQWWFD